MSNARDKANIPSLNFSSTGIDDNATSTAITINSSEEIGIGTTSQTTNANLTLSGKGFTAGGVDSGSIAFGHTPAYQGRIYQENATSIFYIENTYASGSGDIRFKTNGSERVTIEGTGNVGIGISAPLNPLTLGKITTFNLNSTNTGQDALFINNASATAGLNAKGNSIGFGAPDGHGSRHAAISAVQTDASDRDFVGLAFHTHNSGSQSDPMIETMRLTSDGKLGIGTSSPSQKLDVVGSIEVSNGIYLGGTGTANRLDDYEEGTWTPSLIDYAGTPTVQEATYTKIGRLVTVATHISLDGTSDGSQYIISGLPFTSGTVASYYGGFVTYTSSAVTHNIYPFLNTSNTRIYLYKTSGNGMSYNDLGTGANLRLVATYIT